LVWAQGKLSRLQEALEQAYRHGEDAATLRVEGRPPQRVTGRLRCPDCDLDYRESTPNHFSFNSPLGACETCRGFGRTIDLDLDLIIPDQSLSLEEGAIKPWTTDSTESERGELAAHCRRRRIRMDVPYGRLPADARRSIVDGDEKFFGIRGWFAWLETRTYKMHVRVFLSRYRRYQTCSACGGARLKPDALLTRVMGMSIAQMNALPVGRLREVFGRLSQELGRNPAVALIAGEVAGRLRYLEEVGLEYLTLDRQSRTLSGGEVQRVNLTAALGSSLVNTLYVLDEPSAGLHARDNRRLLGILQELRSLSNTLLVVEHDPDLIRGADHLVDLGPGAGAAGGQLPPKIQRASSSSTGRSNRSKRPPSAA
nr:excinuclease ABC subunit A [Candidatus Riflebacteria bacterium]